jgi:hypothetical protein
VSVNNFEEIIGRMIAARLEVLAIQKGPPMASSPKNIVSIEFMPGKSIKFDMDHPDMTPERRQALEKFKMMTIGQREAIVRQIARASQQGVALDDMALQADIKSLFEGEHDVALEPGTVAVDSAPAQKPEDGKKNPRCPEHKVRMAYNATEDRMECKERDCTRQFTRKRVFKDIVGGTPGQPPMVHRGAVQIVIDADGEPFLFLPAVNALISLEGFKEVMEDEDGQLSDDPKSAFAVHLQGLRQKEIASRNHRKRTVEEADKLIGKQREIAASANRIHTARQQKPVFYRNVDGKIVARYQESPITTELVSSTGRKLEKSKTRMRLDGIPLPPHWSVVEVDQLKKYIQVTVPHASAKVRADAIRDFIETREPNLVKDGYIKWVIRKGTGAVVQEVMAQFAPDQDHGMIFTLYGYMRRLEAQPDWYTIDFGEICTMGMITAYVEANYGAYEAIIKGGSPVDKTVNRLKKNRNIV